MPHLVEVWEEYAAEGLVMLALSDEAGSTIEKFVEANDVTYPTAAGSNSHGNYGGGGVPDAYLIDYRGRVIWNGHPGNRGWEELLPEALAEARAMSDSWDPGERHEELEKAVEYAREAKLGRAWKAAQRVLERNADDEQIRKAAAQFQEDFLARARIRSDHVAPMIEEARYFEAAQFLEHQIEVFDKSPPAEEWEEMVEAWEDDDVISDLMDLDEERLEAVALARSGERFEALDDLRDLLEDARGTAIEAAMQAAYDQVTGMSN